MDAHDDTFQGPELDEAVAERIAEMSYAELRDRCDVYRSFKIRYGHGPCGFRFGEWLRDQVLQEITRPDLRPTYRFIAQDIKPILDRYVGGAA